MTCLRIYLRRSADVEEVGAAGRGGRSREAAGQSCLVLDVVHACGAVIWGEAVASAAGAEAMRGLSCSAALRGCGPRGLRKMRCAKARAVVGDRERG